MLALLYLKSIVKTFRSEDDVDTEDEIERILELQKTKNKTGSYLVETDEENIEMPSNTSVPELPDFFSSKVLYVDKELNDSVKSLLIRYITAFAG